MLGVRVFLKYFSFKIFSKKRNNNVCINRGELMYTLKNNGTNN